MIKASGKTTRNLRARFLMGLETELVDSLPAEAGVIPYLDFLLANGARGEKLQKLKETDGANHPRKRSHLSRKKHSRPLVRPNNCGNYALLGTGSV